MSDAKAARNSGTLGIAFTFGSVAAVVYPVFLALISPPPPQGSDAGGDSVGYSTDKLIGMVRTACPMFLAFVFMHITLACTIRRTLGRWQMKDGRDGAEVVAYNATVLVFDLIAVAVGIQAIRDGTLSTLAASAHERLLGYSATALWLCALTAGFELYNTAVCVFILPGGGIEFIIHHALSTMLPFVSVGPYVHAYSFFFFGLANISSVPLAAYSACEGLMVEFPQLKPAHTLLQAAFALLFLAIRCVAWPLISLRFWADTYLAVTLGWKTSLIASSILLLSNLFLTGLQFLWGSKVHRKVTTALGGGSGTSAVKQVKAASKPARVEAYPVGLGETQYSGILPTECSLR